MRVRVNKNDFDVNHPDFQRVFLRRTNSRVFNPKPEFGEPVGWFATKENMAFGYSIYNLTEKQKQYLNSYDIDTVNVFKYAVEPYNNKPEETGFVLVNLGKGFVQFLDYGKLAQHNSFITKWLKEKVRFNRFFIEQNTGETFADMELL